MSSLASQMHGSGANEIHGTCAVLEAEDMEGKDDGHINIDD